MPSFFGTGIGAAFDIAVGPDGNLWFANWRTSSPSDSGTIGRITPSGVVTSFGGTEVDGPVRIAAGPDGNLWFTNNNGDSSIGRITTAGILTAFTDPDISTPWGITAGPDGNLWFANGSSIGRIVPADGDRYHPLGAPQRIGDSRPPPEQVGPYATPWAAGQTREVTVAGGTTGVPTDATAVVLNVTVTATTAPSFLTLWPKGAPARPTASNLNWSAGQTIPNAVTVKVGDLGTINIYNNAGAAHVIIDVVGWYDQSGSGAGYTALEPTRVLDSRPPPEQVGPFTTPWSPGTDRLVTVAGPGTPVPADADAVVLNATVTATTAESFLTVYPNGATKPTASSLNWTAGTTIPNAVTVKVGTDGKVRVFNNSGTTHVILDVIGYFETGTGDAFHPVTPTRFQDSRPPPEQVGAHATPWTTGTTRTVAVTTGSAVPTGANAVLANVTVTTTTAESFLTVWNTGAPTRPTASNLNWKAGTTIANAVTAKVGTADTISIYNNTGSVHVIADAAGWYG